MQNPFREDCLITGLLVGLGSELLTALLLWVGLKVAGESAADHIRWFGGCFIPIVLILRWYVKQKAYPTVVKVLLVTLFFSFVGFLMVAF
ncbi:MAG: hypothetical protein HUK17_04575 [Bacteroidales bacterium]|nr:hypothetical protein [Bacteroidales bacterium]